jgi:hypothetical protein
VRGWSYDPAAASDEEAEAPGDALAEPVVPPEFPEQFTLGL